MNIRPREGVKPISDFRRDSARMLKALNSTHEPILLTQRGRSVAVLLDLETYERLEYVARLRSSYQKGVADIKRARCLTHAEAEKAILGKLDS